MQTADLNLLPVVAVVLEEGNLTRAAERLHLSVSATSRALDRARRVFGDPLLVRRGRGVVPTPTAERLLPRLRGVLDDVDALLPRPEFDPARVRERLVVRAGDAVLALLAGPLTEIVTARAPAAELRFQPETDTDVDDIAEGRATLGIGSYGDLTTEMDVEDLLSEPLVGVLRADHPSYRAAPSAEEFARLPHIVVSRHGRVTGPIDAALRDRGLARTVGAVVPSTLVALLMTARGDATTTAPRRVVAALGAAHGGLAAYTLPVPVEPVRVTQVWHRRHTLDPTHAWLRSCVHRAVADLDGTGPSLDP